MDLDEEEYKATRKLNGLDNDIQVGEYVKTHKGDIHKVIGIREEVKEGKRIYSHKAYYLDSKKGSLTEAFIIKHSKNIIDLIEVGDYVNGRLVLQVDYKNKNVCLLITFTDTTANTNIMWYGFEDIKTICTHEQFNSVMYKVKE